MRRRSAWAWPPGSATTPAATPWPWPPSWRPAIPHAIRGAKRLLNQSGLVSQEQQFLDESQVMGSLIGSPNQVEAVTAFFEKRPPVFADPG